MKANTRLSIRLLPVLATALALITSASGQADAQTSVEDLAKQQQNPVSGLRQVGIDTTVSPDVPVTGGTEASYSLQIVWPFSLGEDWKLITYTILPAIQVPDGTGNYDFGLGDTLLNLFVSPAEPAGDFVWGAGPAVLLPTRSDPIFGSDYLGLGPSAVVYYAKDAWGAGVVLQNVWSLGGQGLNEVNEFGAQYFVNYNLPKGWFLYSNSTVTADWTANSGDRWTLPVGGGVGKVFTVGEQSMSASLQGVANVVRPANAPTWALNLQVSFLFP